MTLAELGRARVLILGLGREGTETYRFLRGEFPAHSFGVADRLPIERLAPEMQRAIQADPDVAAHLGDDYLSSLANYDVVVRSPGVPLNTPAIAAVVSKGVRVTSHTEIFLANCRATTIGVTGTKGKSTTASLIDAILRASGRDAHLVGNIGVPPLGLLRELTAQSFAVLELSSYQLDGIGRSPHVAVLLNIVPEHLDLHGGFENYVRAKQNITRFQNAGDVLVYNAMYPIPAQTAAATKARRFAFSFGATGYPGCFLDADNVVYRCESGTEVIMPVRDVPLTGRFNLQNLLAAVTVGAVLGVGRDQIATAVRAFKPLAYRLEPVGNYREITFYDDPLATIPQATIAALDALGGDVATVLLGGHDRGLDMSELARRLRDSAVRTVILFPPSGNRIRQAIEREHRRSDAALPKSFFTTDMRVAVSLAYRNTPRGKICLHSPASPSFGLFKDYAERGDLFKRYVRELA